MNRNYSERYFVIAQTVDDLPTFFIGGVIGDPDNPCSPIFDQATVAWISIEGIVVRLIDPEGC